MDTVTEGRCHTFCGFRISHLIGPQTQKVSHPNCRNSMSYLYPNQPPNPSACCPSLGDQATPPDHPIVIALCKLYYLMKTYSHSFLLVSLLSMEEALGCCWEQQQPPPPPGSMSAWTWTDSLTLQSEPVPSALLPVSRSRHRPPSSPPSRRRDSRLPATRRDAPLCG